MTEYELPIEAAAAAAVDHSPAVGGPAASADPHDQSKMILPTEAHPGVVAVRFSDRIDALLRPFTLNLDEWAEALFNVGDFPDQDPDDATLAMLASILMAGSSEEVLVSMDLDRARALCGNEPGGHSALLIIRGARPVKSDFEEGPNCYVIVDAAVKADGKPCRFTTGARAVQAAILAHAANNWLPFEARLEIRRERTRRGFYPLNLVAGG